MHAPLKTKAMANPFILNDMSLFFSAFCPFSEGSILRLRNLRLLDETEGDFGEVSGKIPYLHRRSLRTGCAAVKSLA